METIKVHCTNNGQAIDVAMGTSLLELSRQLGLESGHPFLAAHVDNMTRELGYRLFDAATVHFFDITHFEGMRVYQRSLFFTLQKAVTDLWPGRRLMVKHSVSKGFYCEIEGMEPLTAKQVDDIKTRTRELIEADLPITRARMLSTEAEAMYAKRGAEDKVALLRTRPHLYVKVYSLDNVCGYFYGALAVSTGYLRLFDVTRYYHGFHLAVPKRTDPTQLEPMIDQDKMFDIFTEYKEWVEVMGVSNIGSINNRILQGHASELIKVAEAFHEKKLGSIADQIHTANRKKGTRVVLISGPSSSGKTTFAKRLGIQLKIVGLDPVMVSLDDYFVERDKTPVDEKGEYDFDAFEALDTEAFNDDLKLLLKGRQVDVPRYDFITGKRIYKDCPLQLNDRSVLVIEGIHALNPKLIKKIPQEYVFRVYLSAFTSISMDDMSRISTTDNRLLRRIIRDNAHRGYNAAATLKRWGSVRRGEDRNIFPYQEEADVMFNSSLFYEISVLKPFVEPLLHDVPDTVQEYAEARRLLNFIDNFTVIQPDEIPPTSILREFIGGSSFEY